MIDHQFLPDAVQWSEGMLLSPQHFQQNDIHAQAMLQQRLLSLTPHAWGVRRLELDSARLADGLVKVLACEAVMPDGLPLVFPFNRSIHDLSLKVESKNGPDGRPVPVRVFLALPPRSGARPGITSDSSTAHRRYESMPGDPTLDEVTGIGDVVVERQRACIHLFADKVPEGYTAVPLLEMVRDAYGRMALTGYHPPMFRLGASAFIGTRALQTELANLREEMWWKFHKLVLADEDDRPESLAVLSVLQKANLRIAREIAACLPLADTVLFDPLSSPQQAWWAMSQIVGRMAAIGANPCPMKMDPYRHDDCQPQFEAAIQFVRGKLALISTEWDSPEFDRVGDGRYQRVLPPDSPQTIYLELRSREGQNAEGLESWLRKASIASPDIMPLLAQWRVLGASVQALTAQDISARGLRADAIVFKVASQSLELAQGLTQTFRPGHSLEVRGDATHAPAAIILHHRLKNADAPPSTHAADD